jgi:hypothetical protein
MTRPNVFRIPPELIVDPDAHLDKLVPRDQQRLALLRTQSFDLRRPEPADRDHLCQSPASPGSDLLRRIDTTARACRASRHHRKSLSAVKAWVSHAEVAPLSRPTRTTSGARFQINRARTAGSVATFPSNKCAPWSLRMHTGVYLSDTSRPTNVPMAVLLGSKPRPTLPADGEGRRRDWSM